MYCYLNGSREERLKESLNRLLQSKSPLDIRFGLHTTTLYKKNPVIIKCAKKSIHELIPIMVTKGEGTVYCFIFFLKTCIDKVFLIRRGVIYFHISTILCIFQGLEDEVKGRQFSAIDRVYLRAEDEGKIEEPVCKKSKVFLNPV